MTIFGKDSKMTRWKRLSVVFALGVCVSVFAGCQGSNASDQEDKGERLASSLVELFRMDSKDAVSDFEKEVLDRAIKTGKIARVDYEAAAELYMKCIADRGNTVKWAKGTDGIYIANPEFSTDAAGDKYMSDSSECAKGTVLIIEPLYRIQENNPDLLASPYEAIIACLNRVGKNPSGLSAKDLKTALDGLPGSLANFPLDIADIEISTCLRASGFAFG